MAAACLSPKSDAMATISCGARSSSPWRPPLLSSRWRPRVARTSALTAAAATPKPRSQIGATDLGVLQEIIDTLRDKSLSFVRMDECLAFLREPCAA